MSNPMSGEEMVVAHSKTAYELPSVGVKEFEPNHSWLEQKQIQSVLDQRKALLENERIEKECNLMAAEWRGEKRKAAVHRKGKHWETFGHHADGSDWLFPEEAMFLMEMGCLECLYGEVPLSIQKGYSVLLGAEGGCTLDEYRVFAHLCRAGYRVLRHLPNLTVTGYERTIRLDQHMKGRKTYDGAADTVTGSVVCEARLSDKPEKTVTDRTESGNSGDGCRLPTKPGEKVTHKTPVSSEQEMESEVSKSSEYVEMIRKLNEVVTDTLMSDEEVSDPESNKRRSVVMCEARLSDEPEKTVTDRTESGNSGDGSRLSTMLGEKVTDKTPMSDEEVSDAESDKRQCVNGKERREIEEQVPSEEESVHSLESADTVILTDEMKKELEEQMIARVYGTGVEFDRLRFIADKERMERRARKTRNFGKEWDSDQGSGKTDRDEERLEMVKLLSTDERRGTDSFVSSTSSELTRVYRSNIESTKVSNKKPASCVKRLTKRQLRKLTRRNARKLGNVETLGGLQAVKKPEQQRKRSERRWLTGVVRKCKQHLLELAEGSEDCLEIVGEKRLGKTRSVPIREEEMPEVPPERWQPPVVITELPEDVEVTIGSSPVRTDINTRQKEGIEIIDIADTSSEEEWESEEESDSDIEIIQEIRPQSQEDEDEEDEDELEIIEVPIPKKEIIVETLSSDSEKEEEEEEEDENGSSSDSDKSYDGNFKRRGPKKKKKFVRPPTMSHFTFAAVDEFCAEKKLPKDNLSAPVDGNECNGVERKRTVFQVELTRNEILDMMPTMAGQNKKLLTLESPDLRFVPNNITLRQPSYTYNTNVLKARVFRQGFRGRRNFHGMRFSGYNPYYNNNNGNFYPNQLSMAGPEGLFQAPQLTQLLGGGDITSMARGVMQIASALLMNMPQNNMNNRMLSYNPRPQFPMMNTTFPQIASPHMPPSHFQQVNQNFSRNDLTPVHHHGFNQRNNLQNLFDMPQQRNFGTPNHVRFNENSSSPIVEDRGNQNVSVDLSRSSESDFDSSDRNFTPPIGRGHGGGRNFRDNRAANFRSRRGRFLRKNKDRRGGFSQMNSRNGPSCRPDLIDPAYIKPDVPIPGEGNSSTGITDFIPISSSTSNSVDIISIDDNDDGFVPRGGGISRKLMNKKYKRKFKRLEQKAKRVCLDQNSSGSNPEIVFLDSPSVSTSSADNSLVNSVKQETEADARVKTETLIKEETPAGTSVKSESADESRVKVENEAEARVKTEQDHGESRGESSNVRVKVEHGESGQNVSVEIKIESHSDTSSVVSLPVTNLVKEEPHSVKRESENAEVKSEAVDIEIVKTESSDERESKEGIVGENGEAQTESVSESTPVSSEGTLLNTDRLPSTTTLTSEVLPMDIGTGETERTVGSESVPCNQTNTSVEKETREENVSSDVNGEVSCSRTAEEVQTKKVSSWAEMKKNNLPLSTPQSIEIRDETESENEDEEEVRPILRPKHCKNIGTVLSALQIFTPFTGSPSDDVVRLKISFDLYLPTEFRKSHRGLPQYRIVVFNGSEPLPSPAQLREVNARFEDRVPVLTAVVAPGSVVFYTFTDVRLPQDSTSYTK